MRGIESLFDRLPEIERCALRSTARRRRYRRGATIFFEGDPGDSLHLIERGHLAVRVSNPRGDEVTLEVLGPGDCFGEQALLSEDSRRMAAVVCLDATETLAIGRREFVDLRARLPLVDGFLIEVLNMQVRRLSGLLLEGLHVKVETRVHRRLHTLALAYGSGDGPVIIPVTQEDVASMAGTTRPTVNRVLRAAEADGVIELSRGRIRVIDIARLSRLAKP